MVLRFPAMLTSFGISAVRCLGGAMEMFGCDIVEEDGVCDGYCWYMVLVSALSWSIAVPLPA